MFVAWMDQKLTYTASLPFTSNVQPADFPFLPPRLPPSAIFRATSLTLIVRSPLAKLLTAEIRKSSARDDFKAKYICRLRYELFSLIKLAISFLTSLVIHIYTKYRIISFGCGFQIRGLLNFVDFVPLARAWIKHVMEKITSVKMRRLRLLVK